MPPRPADDCNCITRLPPERLRIRSRSIHNRHLRLPAPKLGLRLSLSASDHSLSAQKFGRRLPFSVTGYPYELPEFECYSVFNSRVQEPLARAPHRASAVMERLNIQAENDFGDGKAVPKAGVPARRLKSNDQALIPIRSCS